MKTHIAQFDMNFIMYEDNNDNKVNINHSVQMGTGNKEKANNQL